MRRLRNIRLTLAFDGTSYHGWQIQPDRPTVQGAVREAIGKITGESVTLIGSGRTDAGTHARSLVANFRTTARIPAARFAPALNSVLPPDIRVLSSRLAPPGFHAQRSPSSKTYRYQIYRGPVMLPHLAREHFHFPYPVDVAAIRRAARLFVGRHDFASFAARSGAQPGRDASTVRTVLDCRIVCRGRLLTVTVEGEGFLHHMVRNMVGTLLEIGQGRRRPEDVSSLLIQRDRRLAGFTAPAHGLILLRVRYQGASEPATGR